MYAGRRVPKNCCQQLPKSHINKLLKNLFDDTVLYDSVGLNHHRDT